MYDRSLLIEVLTQIQQACRVVTYAKTKSRTWRRPSSRSSRILKNDEMPEQRIENPLLRFGGNCAQNVPVKVKFFSVFPNRNKIGLIFLCDSNQLEMQKISA